MNSNEMKLLYENSFPIEKIRSDMLMFLIELHEGMSDTYKIAIESNSGEEIVEIGASDQLTIISYRSKYSFLTDFYFEVLVAIGSFARDIRFNSLFSCEKCMALFKYNEDLSLYDIEFYIDEVNNQT